jgi:hypothetical protein
MRDTQEIPCLLAFVSRSESTIRAAAGLPLASDTTLGLPCLLLQTNLVALA